MIEIQIVCINKDKGNHENPYIAINRLGWILAGGNQNGYMGREELYDWLKAGKGKAFVKDMYGNTAYLITAISTRNNKYIKTVPDETKQDNLLSLKEC